MRRRAEHSEIPIRHQQLQLFCSARGFLLSCDQRLWTSFRLFPGIRVS